MQTTESSAYDTIFCWHAYSPRGSTWHTFVEVVLHGQTEGKFLEDPEAHRDETIGHVSKLGGF